MSRPRTRRRSQATPCAEALEGRSLLSAGVGDTFALIPATIAKPGGTTAVQFTINPSEWTLPRHALTLGIDVAAAPSSTVKPFIESIDNPHGAIVPQAFHSIYDPHVTHAQVANGAGTSAMIVPISLRPHDFQSPVTYTVNVQGQSNTSGAFLLDFYLPGDVNGDGAVNAQDIALVKQSLNSVAGDNRYNFDADANRDGRVGQIDLAFTRQNQGVATIVQPSLSAVVSPASLTDVNNRVTNQPSVQFTGTTTPGASIQYTPAGATAPVATTVADGKGNYSLAVPVAPGVNNFVVSSTDGFGQTISGPISPVTRKDQNATS
jgi:hypothetical protein